MGHDIFLSYSSRDKVVADMACAVLEQRGMRCWIAPRNIRPGDDWGETIIRAIEQARAFVLVFSGSANQSQQVKREVERAVNRGLPVIPLRIEDIKPQGALEYFLSTPHWLDAFEPPVERHLDFLAEVLAHILAGKEGRPPEPVQPSPLPKPLPFGLTRRQALAAGGLAAAGLAGLGLARPWAEPAFAGDWTLAESTLNPFGIIVADPIPVAPLTRWGLAPGAVSAKLSIEALGTYRLTTVARSSGSVAALGPSHNWQRGKRLKFTDGRSGESFEVDAETIEPMPSAHTTLGYRAGEAVRLLQAAGKWQSMLFGTPAATAAPGLELVTGSWRLWSPDVMGVRVVSHQLAITSDSRFTYGLETEENGLFDAKDGRWTRSTDKQPVPVTGVYAFASSDRLTLSSSNGTATWTRD